MAGQLKLPLNSYDHTFEDYLDHGWSVRNYQGTLEATGSHMCPADVLTVEEIVRY